MLEKTAIFDLDETLVHCIEDIENNDFDLPICVEFSTGESVKAGINIRPFAYECLKTVQKQFQVVVFTASHKSYANAVLDTLEEEFRKPSYLTKEEQQHFAQFNEPERTQKIMEMKQQQKLIEFRIYRDHCYKTSTNVYVKDLSLIRNRQMKDMIIVDNAVYSFGFHLSNGIPIIPYYSSKTNPNDEELFHLIFYLNSIA